MTSCCEEQAECCGLVVGAVTQHWLGWTSCRTVAAGGGSVGAFAVPPTLNGPLQLLRLEKSCWNSWKENEAARRRPRISWQFLPFPLLACDRMFLTSVGVRHPVTVTRICIDRNRIQDSDEAFEPLKTCHKSSVIKHANLGWPANSEAEQHFGSIGQNPFRSRGRSPFVSRCFQKSLI